MKHHCSRLFTLDKIRAVKFDRCSIFLWVLVFEVLVFEVLVFEVLGLSFRGLSLLDTHEKNEKGNLGWFGLLG